MFKTSCEQNWHVGSIQHSKHKLSLRALMPATFDLIRFLLHQYHAFTFNPIDTCIPVQFGLYYSRLRTIPMCQRKAELNTTLTYSFYASHVVWLIIYISLHISWLTFVFNDYLLDTVIKHGPTSLTVN